MCVALNEHEQMFVRVFQCLKAVNSPPGVVKLLL